MFTLGTNAIGGVHILPSILSAHDVVDILAVLENGAGSVLRFYWTSVRTCLTVELLQIIRQVLLNEQYIRAARTEKQHFYIFAQKERASVSHKSI